MENKSEKNKDEINRYFMCGSKSIGGNYIAGGLTSRLAPLFPSDRMNIIRLIKEYPRVDKDTFNCEFNRRGDDEISPHTFHVYFSSKGRGKINKLGLIEKLLEAKYAVHIFRLEGVKK